MPLAKDLALLAAWAAGSVPGRAARKRALAAGSRMGACPVWACGLGGPGTCRGNASQVVCISVYVDSMA